MTSDVFRLGLIGYPVAHSVSPQIHGAGLAALGLAGEYKRYPVPPLPDGAALLEELVGQIRTGTLTGLNVTIPHKQAVFDLVDDLTPAARAIGAVNALYLQAGKVIGDNTDVGGFRTDLAKLVGKPVGDFCVDLKTALVLGAGGAARAVVYALHEAGYSIALAARNPGQAERLAEGLGLRHFHIGGLDRVGVETLVEQCEDPIGLVVNTTPLGMWPNVQTSAWPAGMSLPTRTMVYDLVYNPRETKLIQNARQNGHPALGGLGMLVEQAAAAFQIWTGSPAPRREMFWAAEQALENKSKEGLD